MQLYRWRARSMAGKLYQGSYLADSKQEVAAFLHENYDYITGIEEAVCLIVVKLMTKNAAVFFSNWQP